MRPCGLRRQCGNALLGVRRSEGRSKPSICTAHVMCILNCANALHGVSILHGVKSLHGPCPVDDVLSKILNRHVFAGIGTAMGRHSLVTADRQCGAVGAVLLSSCRRRSA